jgi:ERCC4-related helicase/predicted nucleic acid-binding protein
MFATVRNRRGVITSVDAKQSDQGVYHLVEIDYKDDQHPMSESLIWEVERDAKALEPNAMPNVASDPPMAVEDHDAVLRAARWGATMPFVDPDADGPLDALPLSSPFHGAFEVEDYQLVPLLKALAMPRVNLLIADDVGLGKTIEAGLILNELLLRRRIRRVLILTPASLRIQWQRDELWDKFNLRFDLVDRQETQELKKRMGMDANPWRSFDRIIASYHYLRQPDVLDQFMAACRVEEGSPRLPWDLLIVDECHNLMPAAFGEESDLTKMLRTVSAQFEHRLFLSATPHNGHTLCFSGLLELLDPVRFSKTDQLKPAEKERVKQVVIRRLKREINARTNPPKFSERLAPKAVPLALSKEEVVLSEAFAAFREAIKELLKDRTKQKQRAGSFAVEMLGKRLLSCPTAFAESWRRCRQGMTGSDAASEGEVDAARKSLEQDTADDREANVRAVTASGVVGAWMKTVSEELHAEIAAIDKAVQALGFDLRHDDVTARDPKHDARFEALCQLIDTQLRNGKSWRNDERLVLFTEYKTTLDYLLRRLRSRYEEERIITLYGGMDDKDRDAMKAEFNDGASPVRILVATDAAAEGLNLQKHARYLLHFDCPWNPSKLEQRNGRIDRHGQPRDVTIHHYVSDQDQDLKFLAKLLTKANDIREDLGSANELFDEAAHRRLVDGENAETVYDTLERQTTAARGRATIDADNTALPDEHAGAAEQVRALADELDLDGVTLRETLESAMAIHAPKPLLECSEELATCKLVRPDLPAWSETIDQSLRRTLPGQRGLGPVMKLAFTSDPFYAQVGPRKVFSPRPDVQMMHLGHPMIQRATGSLTRRRFPGREDGVSRWCVRSGEVPKGADALVLLHVEEIGVNELRETFHHWVRTVAFPISQGKLGEPLPHATAKDLRGGRPVTDPDQIETARELAEDVLRNLKRWVDAHSEALTGDVKQRLVAAGERARKDEEARYQSRLGEVSALITSNTIEKLTREIEQLRAERQQGLLFAEADHYDAIDKNIDEKEAEIVRRTRHHEEVRRQLEKERERIMKHLLPKRHTLAGNAHVFPITLEIRLPQ